MPVIKRKTGKNERGQAIAEMVVCLIPMLAVFAGVILVAVLGTSKIEALLSARAEVDKSSSNGVSGGSGLQNILSWDYGEDRIPFTADDDAKTSSFSTAGASDLDTSMYSVSGYYTPSTPSASGVPASAGNLVINPLSMTEIVSRGYAGSDPSGISFLNAAKLNEEEVKNADPIGSKNLPSFGTVFGFYFRGNPSISEKAVMPSRVD